MSSIAMACNVYQDAAALRGLLEVSAPYFDNLYIVHSGPGGAYSTDGTIELCEEFGIKPVFDDIQRGYGAIRTRLLHGCGCEWAFILDADERFFPILPVITCSGDEKYPDVAEPKLTVEKKPDVINQGAHVKNLINNTETMALRSTRRHWFDFAMTKPSQNFHKIHDHQLRIVRNHPSIHYETNRVMHERLLDDRTGKDPKFVAQDEQGGPFHDHFHLHFRRTQPGKKEANEKNYERLSRGEKMIIP